MPPLADCQNQIGLKAKLNSTCKNARLLAYAAKLVKQMVKQTDKQTNMFAIWPTCQCIFACQLLYTTSQQASPASSTITLPFLLCCLTQGTRSRVSTSCSDMSMTQVGISVCDQVVSPLSSRVSARCPLVQQLPQYRVVSKSALGSLSLV